MYGSRLWQLLWIGGSLCNLEDAHVFVFCFFVWDTEPRDLSLYGRFTGYQHVTVSYMLV